MTDKVLPLADAWQKRNDLHELSYQLLVQCREAQEAATELNNHLKDKRLPPQRHGVPAEVLFLREEVYRLLYESKKAASDAELTWIKAILAKYGNVRVRYYMWQCHLPNGDIYE
jgi:hypothetical protein